MQPEKRIEIGECFKSVWIAVANDLVAESLWEMSAVKREAIVRAKFCVFYLFLFNFPREQLFKEGVVSQNSTFFFVVIFVGLRFDKGSEAPRTRARNTEVKEAVYNSL